jgi:lysozyme
MNFLALERRVKEDEGFRPIAYLDTVGVWTIGYGQTFWSDGSPISAGDEITEDAALQFLRAQLWKCATDCQRDYVSFEAHDHVRQEVLVNMRYNLGRAGLAGFKKMNAAVEKFDYPRWADEMEDSRWFRQVTARAKRLQQMVRTGERF